ncbi:carboxypeptidase-like regulatory domain-containing protein [Olivibacter sitiensis]|uniref:carboxypeptidase-like regulatory domain-containing protein n=1 Tax=Olivibacter sitiensis TaxID=376470 RepID=UPI00040E65C1|nr:carboxypeptidase-like regulatory domain-containing protein [Olivibacter sitiensis]
MRSTLVLLLLLLSSCYLRAQNKGSITGLAHRANNEPIEKATVSVINASDSTVLSYTLTDNKGQFKMYRLPINQKLLLVISHVGLNAHRQTFVLPNESSKDFENLLLEEQLLDEVVIDVGQPPIRMNQDTLEYNTDYFKTRPGANVEALLQQLPGLQVNLDGTIYYEGKEVSSVKVNGKEFFAQDLRIATRNLDADMVQTVQVYRDKGDSKRPVDNENDLPISINLKFKRALVRTDFGKAYASGGSRDRYEAGALLNTFRDTLQISLIGFGNNINRQSFDYSELSQHAGLGRSENFGFGNFGGANYFGVGNDISGGTNVNYDWGKVTKLNLMYLYAYKNSVQNTLSESETDYGSTTQFSKNNSNNERREHRHTLNGKFQHKFDTTFFLRFEPKLGLNRNTSANANINDLADPTSALNTNRNNSKSAGNSIDYSHNFYVEKSYYKKAVLSLNYSQSIMDSRNNSETQQYTAIFGESGSETNQLITNWSPNDNRNSNVRLNTLIPLSEKFRTDIFGQLIYNRTNRKEHIHAINDTESSLQNDLLFHSTEYITGGLLTWLITKRISLNGGISTLWRGNDFDYLGVLPSRKVDKQYWLPEAQLRYNSFTLKYEQRVQGPSLYSIQTVDNRINNLYYTLASTDFDNIKTEQFNVNYSKYGMKGGFYVYGNYMMQDKSVGYSTNRDLTNGRSVSRQYQAPGTDRMYMGTNVSRRINLGKSWHLNASSNLNANLNQQYTTINDIENKSSNLNFTWRQEFTLSWQQWLGISPSYQFGWNSNKNSVQNDNFRDINYATHQIGIGATANKIKGLTLECSYNLRNQAGGISNNQSYHLLNTSLYYNFKNDSQIKLSAFDMLNQNNNVYRGGSANSIYYYESNVLRQYFLLGYVYQFRQAKTK